ESSRRRYENGNVAKGAWKTACVDPITRGLFNNPSSEVGETIYHAANCDASQCSNTFDATTMSKRSFLIWQVLTAYNPGCPVLGLGRQASQLRRLDIPALYVVKRFGWQLVI